MPAHRHVRSVPVLVNIRASGHIYALYDAYYRCHADVVERNRISVPAEHHDSIGRFGGIEQQMERTHESSFGVYVQQLGHYEQQCTFIASCVTDAIHHLHRHASRAVYVLNDAGCCAAHRVRAE